MKILIRIKKWFFGACSSCIKCPRRTTALRVGTFADYPTDRVYFNFQKSEGVLIVRRLGKLYALDSKCPHEGISVDFFDSPGGDHFECVTHGSEFTIEGDLLVGPATTGLARFKIWVDEFDQIRVNSFEIIRKGESASDGAYLEIPSTN